MRSEPVMDEHTLFRGREFPDCVFPGVFHAIFT